METILLSFFISFFATLVLMWLSYKKGVENGIAIASREVQKTKESIINELEDQNGNNIGRN